MIEHLLVIIFAHYLGDYPLQGDFLGTQKANYKYLLFTHCLIWTGCVCLALHFTGLFEPWKLFFLFSVHYGTDRWKCSRKKKEYALTRYLWIDQFIHFLQCVVVWVF